MAIDAGDVEVGAIAIPAGTRIPPPAELAQLLLGKVERGFAFARLASAAALVGALGFAISGDLTTAVGFVVAAALCGFAMWSLTQKRVVGRNVLADPTCVLRARLRILARRSGDMTFLSLDLTDGRTFEVGMSPEESAAIALWLRERNPLVNIAS